MAGIETIFGLLAVLSDVLSLLDRFLQEDNEIARRIDVVTRKMDEKDIRRFRSSCSALRVAMDPNASQETRFSSLKHAEDGFLEYVQVDPRRDIGPLSGVEILAIANAGLAGIYDSRGDELLFRRHRLLAFFHEPRIAREKLFSDFYQTALREQCQKKVDDWRQQELSKLENKDYENELYKYSQVPLSIEQCLAIGQIDRMSYVPRESKDRMIQEIKGEITKVRRTNVTAESLKQKDIRRIEDNFRDNFATMIDNTCREVAKQMLRDLEQT